MSSVLRILATVALAATSVVAYPCACDATNILPSLPTGQNISLVAGESTRFATLGRGVQNYTCSSAGTWTNVGAVARLFDIRDIDPVLFSSLPATELAIPFNPLTSPPHFSPTTDVHPPRTVACLTSALKFAGNGTSVPGYLGEHYFVAKNGTIAPRFDFTATQGPGEFVVASKAGSIPSPEDTVKDVAWLELKGVEGSLAKTVYRVVTAGGQPPSSCATPNATLSVDYAALYYFFA